MIALVLITFAWCLAACAREERRQRMRQQLEAAERELVLQEHNAPR